MASEETEVTSKYRNSGHDQHQLPVAEMEPREVLDLEFPLVRQFSIYSLTLDEIQNTVCGPGKTFGSMNMDEFLTNIWNVEEGHASAAAAEATSDAPPAKVANCGGAPAEQLRRQGSLTLPAPLCRKTVDEVWADFHRIGEHLPQNQSCHENTGNAPRRPTFGDMTLEDFLIKAGVVREGYADGGPAMPSPNPPPPVPPSPAAAVQPCGMSGYLIPRAEASGFGRVIGVGGYGDHHQGMGATSMANGVAYPVGNGNGGRMANGYGPVTAEQQVKMVCASPVNPGSPEGLGGGKVDNSAGYVVDGAGMARGGRKRPADDGTVEMVVERRQRRMIKNRESAARSRARKQQAYTVELEAELNQLKEENARLKEDQRRFMASRKQLLMESMTDQSKTNVRKTAEMLRRCNTVPW